MIVAIAAPTATTTGAPIATNAATRGASATETAETRPWRRPARRAGPPP